MQLTIAYQNECSNVAEAVDVTYSRSSGPGGQHVNKGEWFTTEIYVKVMIKKHTKTHTCRNYHQTYITILEYVYIELI